MNSDPLRTLAAAAAELARLCDRLEHVEPCDPATVGEVAQKLCDAAFALADESGLDLVPAYLLRLDQIEAISPFRNARADKVRSATTWADLQATQLAHDRVFHPDVLGLSRYDHIRHCAFHLAKFPDAVLRGDADELSARRVPDMLLFALKLWTLGRVQLPASNVATSHPFND